MLGQHNVSAHNCFSNAMIYHLIKFKYNNGILDKYCTAERYPLVRIDCELNN